MPYKNKEKQREYQAEHFRKNKELYQRRSKEWRKEYRLKMKKLLVDAAGGKCSNCGYDKCLDALVFHHLDPTKKSFGIGGSIKMNFELLAEEAKKCVLLCSNCHNEEHYRLRQTG